MQQNEEKKVKLFLDGGCLKAFTAEGISREFAFPAVAVSINKNRFETENLTGTPRQLENGAWQAEYTAGPCRMKVTVTPGGTGWFFKQVELFADTVLPTPDYLEVDFQQQQVDNLTCRGYMCTVKEAGESLNDEEGQGVVPGCGYPLFAKDMFTGLEHPAAYNTVVSENNGVYHWRLRHFPVWENRKITSCRAVIGMGSEPLELFYEYLDTVRLPALKTPLIAFCSFWSDPYAGNHEYIATKENYDSLLNAFNKLNLRPEIYTLDAGWQDRQSFLRSKESCGGEAGLIETGKMFREAGSDLSLWVSPNGTIGMSMDFLRKNNVAVGKGASCHYSYGEFGVLMDKRLEDELTKRACELVSEKYGVRHFKVDWDNECATSPEFNEKYPTRNHVREASINVMARINKAAREIYPQLKTRNGRWPSPWHLALTTHVSLPNGGDCEYGNLPALSQRDAASNHRDFLYWCVFCRDKSVFPLDVLDNHEFGHSIRNPFQESPGAWSNACVWAIMRGSSYHQFTLMPESLENWQADILRHCMEMLRKNPQKIITGRSKMFGDNPMQGSIYGFMHPGKDGSCIIGLRNSSPLPKEYVLPNDALFYDQTYPDCRSFRAGEKVIFAPHEVKVLNGRNSEEKLLPQKQCQLVPSENGYWKYYLPASEKPDVLPIHRINELEKKSYDEVKKDGVLDLTFGIKVPWRMRDFKLLFKVNKKSCTSSEITLRTSRFRECRVSSYTIALAEIPVGIPGSGEMKNPDCIPEYTCRYFAADLPQGGDVFFSLTFNNPDILPEDIEVWVSGYEAPARQPEDELWTEQEGMILPLPHPSGFPRNLRLL